MAWLPPGRRALLSAFALAVAAFVVGQLVLASERELSHAYINGAWLLVSLGAALKSLATAKRQAMGGRRRAWQAMALGCGLWCAGMLIWTASELAGVYTPFPSLADVGFVSLAPCFIVAMAFYSSSRPGARTERKHLADIGIVFCLMVLLCSIAFFEPLMQQSLPGLRLFATLARVTLFCTAALVGLLCFWQQRASAHRGVISLLVTGMAILSGVAVWYTHAAVTGRYEVGAREDVLWFLAFLCFIWAAFEEDWHGPETEQAAPAVSDAIDSALPAVAIGVLILTIVVYPHQIGRELRPVLLACGLGLVGLLVLREWSIGRVERSLLAQARHERDRVHDLLWNAPLGIASVDASGRIEVNNPLFAELLGFEPLSIEGEPRLAVLGLPALVREARETRVSRSLECTLHEGRMHLVFRAAATSASVLLIAEDVTEQRRLAEQLWRTQKLELLGTLAGGIAHDFNNLLTAAMAGTSLVRAELDAAAQVPSCSEYLDQVERALRQSATLTRRLLTLGRKHTATLAQIDPAVVADRAMDILRLALPDNVRLEQSLPHGLARVRADADQLEQALLNLGLNARDAMPQGGTIRVDLEHCPDASGASGEVVLSVADDGAGILPDARERLFEPFFTTKPPGVGTGLGLPMVAMFAQQHGGTVSVESSPGQGARFRLTLPTSAPPASGA